METYVVRIYRRSTDQVAGTVEDVRDGWSKSFIGFDELRAVLQMDTPGIGAADHQPLPGPDETH